MVKASVDMSLDDIIAKTRKGKGTIGKKPIGGRKIGGGTRKPLRGGAGSRKPVGGARGGWRDLDAPGNAHISSGNANKVIRVNVSNLAPNVIAADLDELFGNFGLETSVVNYNEHGQSLGTGDITLRQRDAERLIREFGGVALDGKVMKFAIVNTSNISGRVDFGGARRVSGGAGRARVSGGRAGPRFNKSKPEDFLRDGVHAGDTKRGRGGARRGGANGKKERGEGKSKKTEAELDAELEAYMSKRKV
ncbi:unnamed protein product [Caenorhabditis angaria]|uniref:Chromatin target of PRMT1 protein C-terminal domain-containing protein n=1 Tax=Caenorhabditis angaria TaxID=860376 RepID=A0A9P1IRC7_9PELO|nr:unnamed protein product [Caenorhabditis angaria]